MLGRVQRKNMTELGSTVAADWSVGPHGYGSATPKVKVTSQPFRLDLLQCAYFIDTNLN